MGLMPDDDPVHARFTRCNGCRRVTRSYLGMTGFCECLAGTTNLGWKQLVQTPAGKRVWKYPQLGVAVTTVYALCQARRLAHIRIGASRGAIRISAAALDEYIQTSAVAVDADSQVETQD